MNGETKKDKCSLTNVIDTELEILRRHIHILRILEEDQPMGIIKLSEYSGYPQHMVRYSLRILEQEGLIRPSSRGAVTTENYSKIIKTLKMSLMDISRAADELRSLI